MPLITTEILTYFNEAIEREYSNYLTDKDPKSAETLNQYLSEILALEIEFPSAVDKELVQTLLWNPLFLVDHLISPIDETKLRSAKKHLEFLSKAILKKAEKNPPQKEGPILLSFIRKKRHIKKFGIPQSASTLNAPPQLTRNPKLLRALVKIYTAKSGPQVIPSIVDHWTTYHNLRGIINTGAFYGSALLMKKQLPYSSNCLGSDDITNLDGNVICLAPRFVDIKTFFGTYPRWGSYLKRDLMRLRINLRKIDNIGKFNTFFKVVDLCAPSFTYTVHLSEALTIEFENIYGMRVNTFKIHFSYLGKRESVILTKNDLIFYGTLEGMNRFCLLLPFVALERCDPTFFQSIYEHLNTFDETELEKVFFSQSEAMISFSEYNIDATLPLTPHLIYDIHDVFKRETYPLFTLSEEEYAIALSNILHLKNPMVPQSETVLTFPDYTERKAEVITMKGTKIGYFIPISPDVVSSYQLTFNLVTEKDQKKPLRYN